jgi:ethanolamine ammonia-lyase large subunit
MNLPQSAEAVSMVLSTTLRGEHFAFADLREVFAKANEEKSGDARAGLAARSRVNCHDTLGFVCGGQG